jgi:hypothetical protein
MLRAQSAPHAPPARLWPNLARRLLAFALVAGCSGQSPLQVKTTNPLEHDDRDVLVAGRGCDVGCAAQGGSRATVERGGSGVARPVAGYGGVAGSIGTAGNSATGTAGVAGGSVRPRPPLCGDGVINGTEVCDRPQLDGTTCASFGYAGGLIACTSSCTFDVSMCRSQGPDVGVPWIPVDAGIDDDDGGVEPPGI